VTACRPVELYCKRPCGPASIKAGEACDVGAALQSRRQTQRKGPNAAVATIFSSVSNLLGSFDERMLFVPVLGVSGPMLNTIRKVKPLFGQIEQEE
jgi:hypothetical protein